VLFVDRRRALAADLDQAFSGNLFGPDEMAVGGADAAVGQLSSQASSIRKLANSRRS
jgi:hypothetical protein